MVEISVPLARASSNLYRGAIHVHFPIANLVVPSPGQSVGSSLDSLRNGVAVCVGVWGQLGLRATSWLRQIAGLTFGWTSSLDGMDNHPL